MFKDHTEHGDAKVLIPNPDAISKFEAMKTMAYDEFKLKP